MTAAKSFILRFMHIKFTFDFLDIKHNYTPLYILVLLHAEAYLLKFFHIDMDTEKISAALEVLKSPLFRVVADERTSDTLYDCHVLLSSNSTSSTKNPTEFSRNLSDLSFMGFTNQAGIHQDKLSTNH